MEGSGGSLSGFGKLLDAICNRHRPMQDESHIDRFVCRGRNVVLLLKKSYLRQGGTFKKA